MGVTFRLARLCILGLILWWAIPAYAQPAWVVIHQGNGVTAHNIPQELSNELTRVVAEKQPIRSVFLTHAGGWGLIYGRNGFATRLPADMQDLNQAIQVANQQNQEIRVITVTPDSNGWAMLLDDRQIVAQRCPSKFVEFYTGSAIYHRVECLAMGAGGWYLMTFDGSGYDTWISQDFLPKLTALNQSGEHLRFVWMAPGQEGVVYGDCGLQCTGLAPDLLQHLSNLNARNQRIEVVAVRMDGSGNSQLALNPNLQATPPPTVAGRTLTQGGASVELPAGVEATAQLQAVQPPPPANRNARLVSEACYLQSQQMRFDPPLKIKIRFDPSKVKTGHKVYPVLGAGPLLEHLTPDRVDLQQGLVELSLNHTLPQVHSDGSAPNKYFLAVASDIDELTPVLTRSDCVVYGAGTTVEVARAAAPAVADTYSQVRKIYTGLGFALPARLDIYLLPLSGARGEADGGHLTLDLNLWDNQDGIKCTLAHETFHVCQGNSVAGFDTDQRTQSESNWAAEATAHYMGYRLFPRSPNMRLWTQSLRPEYALNDLFTFVPNSEGENPGVAAHQYQSFIFFAYLDGLYPATDIIRAMYRNPASRPGPPAASLPVLLDTVFQSTADRSGRKRSLADVYVDFLVHYLWRKDFQPLAADMNAEGMGKPGALKQPQPQVGQNLPYDGKQREYSKTLRATTAGYGLVRAYNLSSMTSASRKEEGDLTIQAGGAGTLRLVVFPYKDGPQPPLLGSSTRPVVVPKWQNLGGAIVWLIQAGEDRGVPVTLTASMPGGPAKEMWVRDDPKVNPGHMSLQDEGRTIQMNSGSASVQEPGGRTFQFTWTAPPKTLEYGQHFPMTLAVRRTQGDTSFRMARMVVDKDGVINAISYIHPSETFLRAWLEGGWPERNTQTETSGEFTCNKSGAVPGDSVTLTVRVMNWSVESWTYHLRKARK